MITDARAKLGGLILAAGASERMGAPKALLTIPWSPEDRSAEERPPEEHYLIVDQAVRLLAAGCDRIVCVLGASAEEIERRAGQKLATLHTSLILIRNENWIRGVFSSIQAGLAAIGPVQDGVIILPVDVPGVATSTFAELLREARAGDGWDAVVPVFEGRGGHPVWLSQRATQAIREADPAGRLDYLLRGMRVKRLEVRDGQTVLNINAPEDWRRYLLTRARAARQARSLQ